MTLTVHSADHERALAAGFDILEGGPITRWARPDSAQIERIYHEDHGCPPYRASVNGRQVRVYTMREAVEWIGPVDELDIEWHESREG